MVTSINIILSYVILSYQGLKTPFCVPTDELLQAKDDLLSEGGQSLSSLTEQVVRQSLQPNRHSFSKAALDTQKGANLGLKCVKMRLAGAR